MHIHPSVRRSALSLLAASVLLAGRPATAAGEHHDNAPTHWVGSWSAAVAPPAGGRASGGFTNVTLRQVAHVSVGGDQVRIRVSNVYGDRPLAVGAATVATRADVAGPTPSVDATSITAVTFDGARTATISAGTERLSDPVDLDVAGDSDLVVSLYLPGPTGPASFHIRGLAASFQASGDA